MTHIEWTPDVVKDWLELRFMNNVTDARENGYDVVCVDCGAGLAFDGCDMHESHCPHEDE